MKFSISLLAIAAFAGLSNAAALRRSIDCTTDADCPTSLPNCVHWEEEQPYCGPAATTRRSIDCTTDTDCPSSLPNCVHWEEEQPYCGPAA
ncbi:hypothetical protein N7488_007933 [Penicillium malachiteum]|nr:hypothetical protein N7488_007933 [Penicillium malachiteum]